MAGEWRTRRRKRERGGAGGWRRGRGEARRAEQQHNSAQRGGPVQGAGAQAQVKVTAKVTSFSATLAASHAALLLLSRHFRANKPSPFDESAFFPFCLLSRPRAALTASCAGIAVMLREGPCALPCFRTIHRHVMVMTMRVAVHLAFTIGRAHPLPCNQSCVHPTRTADMIQATGSAP